MKSLLYSTSFIFLLTLSSISILSPPHGYRPSIIISSIIEIVGCTYTLKIAFEILRVLFYPMPFLSAHELFIELYVHISWLFLLERSGNKLFQQKLKNELHEESLKVHLNIFCWNSLSILILIISPIVNRKHVDLFI